MNATPTSYTTAHLGLLAEQTRDRKSVEEARFAALDSNPGLARSLGQTWDRIGKARLDVIIAAMRDGIPLAYLTFVTQEASDRQLMDLVCEHGRDAQLTAMIDGWMG